MSSIQYPQFDRLKLCNIGHDLRTCQFPGRAFCDEAVLNYPLFEWFCRKQCIVPHSRCCREQGNILIGGLRHDAVDHRIWKAEMVAAPVGQRKIQFPGKSVDDLLQYSAIIRQIVTADDVKRACSSPPSRRNS